MDKSLLYEKMINHKNSSYFLLNNLKIHHIKVDFRINQQNNESVLLLILNLCVLEKILGSSFMFIKQKKNIRKFAPIGTIIGASLFFNPNINFLRDFLFFFSSKKHFFFRKKKIKRDSFYNYNNFVYINFSFSDFIHFSNFKLSRNNWETFSYLYDKQIYGLDVSLGSEMRFYLFNKLLLSTKGIYVLEENE